MLKIVYTAGGEAVSDFKLHEFIETEIECFLKASSGDWVVEVSTENVVLGFELRALEGDIPLNRIEFYCDDVKLDFDMRKGLILPDGVSFGAVPHISREIFNKLFEIGERVR